MHVVAIGAGAWGLPAAAELARRGHRVTLVDRHGAFNQVASSSGPTRLWRLADPDPGRVRLARRGVESMRRLSERADEAVFLTRGLLWRDDLSLPALTSTMRQEAVPHEVVAAADVGRFFAGLRDDGRDAVWQPEAGVVLADVSLRAQLRVFESHGGAMVVERVVTALEVTPTGVRVDFGDGGAIDADAAVVAAGPGAAPLLETLGVDVALHPYLEQVVHFGDPARPSTTDDHPCLFDGPSGDRPGIYAMPSPGVGYKVGLDTPLRDHRSDDDDRTPDACRTSVIRDRVRSDLRSVVPTVLDEQICSWTDSPDGRFVVDRLDGGIVYACGDCGEGFKYSALMGEILADLVEDRTPDDDVRAFSMARFASGMPERVGPHVLGRH
ncbi:FAD-dependent oxidoreductase [Mycolicibacterium sediminis]|uniref:N-methyl-L-tryptophan oxidase n=1 Tax=Mycolicibacterium sediminis TaxID=1286180 RepID=A0A7I7QQJ8_9MYCO|nr:FAD-dependent oxidoreductase [Mycolicibacterium sediminis]BBY28472.1 N-methyl-L-tryptophan oxidase [Mycolicibacterium sediminis]